MAKYDEQLSRMAYLMEYKTPKNEVKSNIEYHANGADGKVYGILKEGTKYYIKTTESGKENISESYEYINGFNSRKENEFKSYNDATKHLELKLMSLNEAYGKHEDVSTVDFKRNEKILAELTEEARRELDRVNQIFENSCKIGKDCICDEESKGKSTGDDTVKNNEPFTEKTEASLDKDPKTDATLKDANADNKTVSNVEKDLQSDKNKTANSGSEKDYKDAHDDLDGEGVADKKPAGGKVVKVNEGIFEVGEEPVGLDEPAEEPSVDLGEPVEEPTEVEPSLEEPSLDLGDGEEAEELEDDEFGGLLEELENAAKSIIVGPEKTLDGPEGELDVQTCDNLEEDEQRSVEGPDEDVVKNEKNDDKKLPVQTCDKLNENAVLESIVEDVYNKLVNESAKSKLEAKILAMVNEELDAWGKHPKFRKPFMTLPDNKEVLAGTADRDFNDDSAKGEEPYAKKIGDGKPFEKVVEILTDQVMSQLKEQTMGAPTVNANVAPTAGAAPSGVPGKTYNEKTGAAMSGEISTLANEINQYIPQDLDASKATDPITSKLLAAKVLLTQGKYQDAKNVWNTVASQVKQSAQMA